MATFIGKRRRAELAQRLANASSVAAVVGMPGLGKTTLASMFVEQYGPNYSGEQLAHFIRNR